jgi:hypothetical protein
MKTKSWIVAFIICMVLATLSPLASSSPDGLEKVAGDKGFLDKAGVSPFSVAADYLFPGVENETLATVMAGWLGTVVVFGMAFGSARLIYRLKGSPARP